MKDKAKQSRRPRRKRAKGKQHPTGRQAAKPTRSRSRVPRKATTLVRKIFASNDPVDVAGKLLKGERDATAGRVYLQLLGYLYGPPGQPVEERGAGGEKIEYQLVSNVPRPQYPPAHYLTGAPGANAAAAPAANLGPRSNNPESSSE